MRQHLPTHDDYAVGWLCALPLELGAAKGMLDEEHEMLPPQPGDSNTYTLGRIGQHNVVLACLPGYGTARAATSASNMLRSFPKIQIGLMVGIGGGVPSSQSRGIADVRLGDVVVGEFVIQYDVGKTERSGFFKRTGEDRQPPNHIMTAVSHLRGDHKLMPSRIPSILAEMLKRHPFMKEHYARPAAASDQLFDAMYDHFEACNSGKATTCDNCNPSQLLARSARSNEHPMIHYGRIASGNQVIKHGVTRDRVAGDLCALCFDMEAAGLADAGFPCLVVRGISDYADSHKKNRWQEYAAAVAAAYAKELLSVVPSGQKETWKPFFEHLRRTQLRFLQTLQFNEIGDRQGQIPKAFQTTFEWLYQKPEPDEDWSSFVDWLESGGDTYWITGKPGSGKSTLMKFLENDERTKRHLHVWSNEHQLVTAGFYFWNSGTELQMSTLGLLRSLLYSVFKKCPNLIPLLCPERWEALHLDENTTPGPWTLLELRKLLLLLSSEQFSHMRFFFLIDGLDEFIGDHDDLIQLTRDLVACKHIKACVASRPWVVFQQVFGRRPNLMLQHLTVKDIEIFVRTTFNDNDDFRRMHSRNQQQAELFLTEIMNRSSGVFLWVRLATQSLLRGLSNGDKMSDLQKRLDEIPGNLEDLFRRILDMIEPRYRKHAAELFRIHGAHQSISALRMSFADEENHETWSEGAPEPLGMDEFVDRCDQIRRRIDSRTMGLLELNKHDTYTSQEYDSMEGVGIDLRNKCRVQYLHRTVKDFIETEHTWNDIVQTSSTFDPYFNLCKAMILEVKKWDPNRILERHLRASVKLALVYASIAMDKYHEQLIQLLNCLESIVSALFRQGNFGWKHLDSTQSKTRCLLMPWAIQLDLHFWVQHLLDNGQPSEPREGSKSYLSFALSREAFLDEDLRLPQGLVPSKYFGSGNRNSISNRCLRLLFRHGASPYWRQDEEPLWKNICFEISECCSSLIRNEAGNNLDCWIDAAIIFKEYGADVSLLHRFIPDSTLQTIRMLNGISVTRLLGLLDTNVHKSSNIFSSPRLLRLSKVRKSYKRKKERLKLSLE